MNKSLAEIEADEQIKKVETWAKELQKIAKKRKGINKVKKGYRVEKRCADELIKRGYFVWKTIRVPYCNIDMFGLFDVVALTADGSSMFFIQCKTNRCDKETREKIRSLKMPPNCYKELWIWKDREGWIKEMIKENK